MRPSRHIRRVWTKLGKQVRLINPWIKKKSYGADISYVVKSDQRLREHQSRQYQTLISEGTPRLTAYEMVYSKPMEYGIPQMVLPQYRQPKTYGNLLTLGPVSDLQVKRIRELQEEIQERESRKPRTIQGVLDNIKMKEQAETKLRRWSQ